MPTITNRTIRRYAGIQTNCTPATEVLITINDNRTPIRIWRVKIKQTGGSATSFQPRIFKAPAAGINSIDQEFVGSSSPAANIFDAVTQVDCVTDTSGNIYLRFGPNAGADNTYAYEVFAEVGR